MPDQKPFDLHLAYSDLNKACSLKSYDKLINIANKILSKCPNELKAFQCKVVALIRQEKYDDCLGLIKKNPFVSNVVYEKAYIEYRLNRMNDSFKTLELADSNDLKVQELKAQVDEYEEERLTNLAAVAAAASCFGDSYMDLDVSPEMYEGKFNLACYHLGRGEVPLASKLLQDAKTDDQEISEEEKNEELAPMKVQEAYILQLQKKEEAANQIYQSVIRQRVADNSLLAVAANNIVCINKEQNIFDSRKRIKMTLLDGIQHKLFGRQRINMLINQGLFYWHTNQMDACHSKLRSVMQDESHPRALLLTVAQLVKEKHLQKALDVLQEYCNTLSNSTLRLDDRMNLSVFLTMLQLHFCHGNKPTSQSSAGLPDPKNAFDVAQMISQIFPPNVQYLPGILSTRVALYLMASGGLNSAYSRDECMTHIVECIQSAVEWYERSNLQNETYSKLLDHFGSFLLQNGQPKMAVTFYEKQLAKLDASKADSSTTHQILVACLVRAYAQFDRAMAEKACKSLSPNDVLSEADVDTLETAFLYGAKSFKRLGGKTGPDQVTPKPKLNARLGSDGKNAVLNAIVESKSRSKRKKRKIRLPKNYQPGLTPDPDRWLPRRERANYRGKRRDKRHPPTRGPQGQVSGVSEWDATARSPKTVPSTSPRVETNTNSTPKQISGSARQQQRKGKKKGR